MSLQVVLFVVLISILAAEVHSTAGCTFKGAPLQCEAWSDCHCRFHLLGLRRGYF